MRGDEPTRAHLAITELRVLMDVARPRDQLALDRLGVAVDRLMQWIGGRDRCDRGRDAANGDSETEGQRLQDARKSRHGISPAKNGGAGTLRPSRMRRNRCAA